MPGTVRHRLLLGLLVLLLQALIPAALSTGRTGILEVGPGRAYGTIQAAVNAARANDIIHVYPGEYDESVDLSLMTPDGNLTLRTVNTGGAYEAGSAAVNGGESEAFRLSHSPFGGDLTIEGFIVASSGAGGIDLGLRGDITVRDVTANGNWGSGIVVHRALGATVVNCTANFNGADPDGAGAGIAVWMTATGNVDFVGCNAHHNAGKGIVASTFGGLTISECDSHGNGDSGVYTGCANGGVEISNCRSSGNAQHGFAAPFLSLDWTSGDVHIENCTASGNGGHGVWMYGGYRGWWDHNITIGNCTLSNNSQCGMKIDGITGNITTAACVLTGNVEEGVALVDPPPERYHTVNGNIICGNGLGLRMSEGTIPVDAQGNWWGCSDGPGAAECDAVVQDGAGVDFGRWLDSIVGTTSQDPVPAGQAATVNFRFGRSGEALYLPMGPGDLHGDPLFSISTDNGTLSDTDEMGTTIHGFITGSDGTLSVTLVPGAPGTATVTLGGPCNLDESITIQVSDSATPTPSPTTTHLPVLFLPIAVK